MPSSCWQASKDSPATIPADLGHNADLKFVLKFPHPEDRGGLIIESFCTPEALALIFDPAQKIMQQSRIVAHGPRVDWAMKSVERSVDLLDLDEATEIGVQVLLDGSVVEVFLSTGQTLGARFYRGDMCNHQNSGLHFVAQRGEMVVMRAEGWSMGTIWKET